MSKTFSKAFSIVELLVACAILAIVCSLIYASYSTMQKQAVAAAQDKDQTAFQQAFEAFHMTGGNVAAILSSALSNDQKAAALTQLLQNTSGALGGVYSQDRTQMGTAGNLISSDKVIVYDPAGTGKHLKANGSNTGLILIPTGPGYVLVDRTSTLGAGAVPATAETTSLMSNASSMGAQAGNKFAAANQYVYDEDPNPVNITQQTSKLSIALPSNQTYTYSQYTSAGTTLPITVNWVGSAGLAPAASSLVVYVQFGSNPPQPAALNLNAVYNTGSQLTATAATFTAGSPLALNTLFPATSWTQNTYNLTVSASSSGISSASSIMTLTADGSTPVANPVITDPANGGTLALGNTVTIVPADTTLGQVDTNSLSITDAGTGTATNPFNIDTSDLTNVKLTYGSAP